MNNTKYLILVAAIVAIVLSAGCTDKKASNDEQSTASSSALVEASTNNQPIPSLYVETTAVYSIGSINEDPLTAAKLADDKWRILADQDGFRAVFAVSGIDKHGPSKSIPDLKFVFPEGETIELKNVILSRGVDDFGKDCYLLTSDAPEARYGLSVGSMNGDSSNSNIAIAEWKGQQIKFFEGETGPSSKEKVVISISGFI